MLFLNIIVGRVAKLLLSHMSRVAAAVEEKSFFRKTFSLSASSALLGLFFFREERARACS
jgi:hypothetical protein